jgi:hypothetical protein
MGTSTDLAQMLAITLDHAAPGYGCLTIFLSARR